MTEIDHKEKLFLDFKQCHLALEDTRHRLREHNVTMEALHKEAHDQEREYQFLKRAIHLVIAEDMDPILAKFKVSEETKQNPEKTIGSLGYAIMSAEDDRYRPGKFKRMYRAFKEIWCERH